MSKLIMMIHSLTTKYLNFTTMAGLCVFCRVLYASRQAKPGQPHIVVGEGDLNIRQELIEAYYGKSPVSVYADHFIWY